MNERLLKRWLKDLTPAKVELIVQLEKAARLLAHVKQLTGDCDPKLVERLVAVSAEIKKAYRDVREE